MILKKSYQFLQLKVVEPFLLPLVFSPERKEEGKVDWKRLSQIHPMPKNPRRVWLHAASVGELESISPLIEKLAEQDYELILSILSESAKGSLQKLKNSLTEKKAKVVYWGYSPWDGKWKAALERLQPACFITAKYEAWPELWMSLQELSIPLLIVSARVRKSLRTAKRFCEWTQGSLPQLVLFSAQDSDTTELQDLFPQAQVKVVGEPRWDRVMERSRIGNPRAKELIRYFQSVAPRPWGVLGSIWQEDLNQMASVFQNLPGTLWIVPHRIDAKSLQGVETFLKNQKKNPVFTQGLDLNAPAQSLKSNPSILVDEMGFLSELYSVADWAYIGGGFGSGLHSTIEPAIHGIPVAGGPKRAEQFSEVGELGKTGQLQILRKPEDFVTWSQVLLNPSIYENKTRWKENALRRLGATQKIIQTIENLS